MARYVYKTLSLQHVPDLQPYCLRACVKDEALSKSVLRSGILQPLIVTAKAEVISGHRRLEAAKNLKLKEVEVLQIGKEISPQEAFLLALLSNWKQSYTEWERASAIFRARYEFKFSEAEILSEVLPAFGMPSDKSFYEESLEVMALAPELRDLIASEKLPFRGSRILSRFTLADQKTFAGLAQEAALTTNQLLKLGEWLKDLLKISKTTLQDFLTTQGVSEILKTDQERKAKGERIFHAIRDLRFPNVADREKKISGLSEQFKDDKAGISIEVPPFLEAEGITLKAKLKDAKSLDQVLGALESKRKVLNSLLDIVL